MIKLALKQAGVVMSIFKAHPAREAAASRAVKVGVPLAEIRSGRLVLTQDVVWTRVRHPGTFRLRYVHIPEL